MPNRIYNNICELVGNTPVVRLKQISEPGWAELLAKLEFLNPGGSVKDRIGLSMIEAAEKDGRLKPGGTIVEPASNSNELMIFWIEAWRITGWRQTKVAATWNNRSMAGICCLSSTNRMM